MSNLKFQRTYTTDNKPELMYVSFEKDGKEYKWFPKWYEIYKLVQNSWVTESMVNEDKNTEYLIISLLLVVLRDAFRRNMNKQSKAAVGLAAKYNEICQMFHDCYSGEDNAKGR